MVEGNERLDRTVSTLYYSSSSSRTGLSLSHDGFDNVKSILVADLFQNLLVFLA